MDTSLLCSASKLNAVMHCTGGKVGSANLWRRSVDETIDGAWTAFSHVRSTYESDGEDYCFHSVKEDHNLWLECTLLANVLFRSSEQSGDLPLHFNRLTGYMVMLVDLLRYFMCPLIHQGIH